MLGKSLLFFFFFGPELHARLGVLSSAGKTFFRGMDMAPPHATVFRGNQGGPEVLVGGGQAGRLRLGEKGGPGGGGGGGPGGAKVPGVFATTAGRGDQLHPPPPRLVGVTLPQTQAPSYSLCR